MSSITEQEIETVECARFLFKKKKNLSKSRLNINSSIMACKILQFEKEPIKTFVPRKGMKSRKILRKGSIIRMKSVHGRMRSAEYVQIPNCRRELSPT